MFNSSLFNPQTLGRQQVQVSAFVTLSNKQNQQLTLKKMLKDNL